MIALSLYKNKKLKLVNKKISNKVKPKGCRIKILYSGVCASDIPRAFQSMAYRYPLVMGHEFVGRVIKTGSKVNNFEIGDLVSAFPLYHAKTVSTVTTQNITFVKNMIITAQGETAHFPKF